MSQGRDGAERHPRLSLFVRTQLPVAASLAILRLLMLVFGIPIEQPLLLATGAISIGLITIAALVLPSERWPQRAQAVFATLDLIAICVVALAMHSRLDTVAVLAAFPAIWLAIVAGWAGAGIGMTGAFTASLLPLVVQPDRSPEEWAAALVLPGAISVVVVVARVLAARSDRAERQVVAVAEERAVADAEAQRLGTVLRSFADNIDLGLLFLDEKGDAVIVNAPLLEFGRLARYDDETGVGMRMYEADQVTPIQPDDQPLARVRRGEEVNDLVHWVGPRGAQRCLLANGRRVHLADGTFAGSMVIVQDITEVVRESRTREDALATLAHELRTPLTSIVGYTELLLGDALSPGAVGRVEVIARNAEQLLRLTSVFLDGLHRHPEGHRERVGVRDVVEATVDVLVTTPGFTERELVIDVDPALAVVADREGLVAVLTNLLGNAVKFSRTCDRVEIVGAADDAWVSLAVRNTGSHIDAADLERIFDRFYRGGNAQRDAVAGTGIGLSVSRDIVAAHGGTLTADAVDEGASFTVCLPRE